MSDLWIVLAGVAAGTLVAFVLLWVTSRTEAKIITSTKRKIDEISHSGRGASGAVPSGSEIVSQEPSFSSLTVQKV